jgi:vitamin B12 transporter
MNFHLLSFPRRGALAAAIVSILPLAAAHADAPDDLHGIVVTGVRHAQTVDDSLASVTLITRADIEKSPAVDLISLLAQQAGVDVSRTGGAGQSSTVFLRGANSNQTLILIDGVRVAASTNSVFDFANLPLDQIDRIEIVRGPRAAFWGSDAIGGVIQIFTRNPDGASLRADAGSYGLRGGSASFGTPADSEGHFGATVGVNRQRGFSATNAGPCAVDPFCSFNPDDDGYHNRNASLRGSIALGTQTLAITALHTDGDAMFDAGPTVGPDPTRSNARNDSGGVTWSGPVTSEWSQSLTIGGARNTIATPIFGSRTISHRTTVDWVNTIANVGDGTLTLGGNWQRERGTSMEFGGTDYARATTNAAGFAGYDAKFGTQQIELAIRQDHNSQFGGATTGTAAWGWQIDPQWRMRASWGQGFRAPSFDELYSPGFFGLFAGNAHLHPEHSQSFEAGLEFKPAEAHAFKLSAWRTRVRDLIAFDGPNFDAVNIARANLDGAELSYRYASGSWSAGGSITAQNPRDADSGDRLLRRPRRKLAADAHYDFGNGLDVSVDGLTASSRADFGGVRLGGYTVLNLAAGWSFHPGWRAELRAGNLFDKGYALADGYNTPGRNAQISLIWRP